MFSLGQGLASASLKIPSGGTNVQPEMRTVAWMVMKLCRWMRWPREGVENDKRIHLPVPSIPGPLTPPGSTGRSERADNPEQLPSHLYPSSYMTQGKERQRGDTLALSTSPGSEVTKWILLSPFLPPSLLGLPGRHSGGCSSPHS